MNVTTFFTVLATSVLLFLSAEPNAQPQPQPTSNWNDSPQNWQNSQQNWNNSSSNWNNSPSNWENSASNYNATNGVFDNGGNRIGYETKSPEGVTNVYDNNGNRMGYVPANEAKHK